MKFLDARGRGPDLGRTTRRAPVAIEQWVEETYGADKATDGDRCSAPSAEKPSADSPPQRQRAGSR